MSLVLDVRSGLVVDDSEVGVDNGDSGDVPGKRDVGVRVGRGGD